MLILNNSKFDSNNFAISNLTFQVLEDSLWAQVQEDIKEDNCTGYNRVIITIFHTHRSWYIRVKEFTFRRYRFESTNRWGYPTIESEAYRTGSACTYSVGLNLEEFLNRFSWCFRSCFFEPSLADCSVPVRHCDSNLLFDLVDEFGGRWYKMGPGRNEIELPLFEKTGGYTLSEEVFAKLTRRPLEEVHAECEKARKADEERERRIAERVARFRAQQELNRQIEIAEATARKEEELLNDIVDAQIALLDAIVAAEEAAQKLIKHWKIVDKNWKLVDGVIKESKRLCIIAKKRRVIK